MLPFTRRFLMGRAVSLLELNEWLKKPKIIAASWFHGKLVSDKDLPEDFKDLSSSYEMNNTEYQNICQYFKYIDLGIDTREMIVWNITLRGGCGDKIVIRDSNDETKTILDEVEEILDKKITEHSK